MQKYKVGDITFEVTKPSLKERFKRWIEEMYTLKECDVDVEKRDNYRT